MDAQDVAAPPPRRRSFDFTPSRVTSSPTQAQAPSQSPAAFPLLHSPILEASLPSVALPVPSLNLTPAPIVFQKIQVTAGTRPTAGLLAALQAAAISDLPPPVPLATPPREDEQAPPSTPVAEFETAVPLMTVDLARKPKPSDFEVLHEVGKGAFGLVLKVRHRASSQILAMKVIEKRAVVQRGSGNKYVMSERDLLRRMEHPFIVHLRCTLQTKTHLYMIMEFLSGGELFTHIRNEGLFSEPVAAFYAAEIVLALEHLHSHKIVHRDLKPENVLLDEAGHVRITDFGLAAELPDDTGLKSMCGSPAYMAPEMLAGKIYGPAVDWWSLGTLIFEMLTGDPPHHHRDRKKLYQKIMSENVKFPPFLSPDCIKLLRGLLDRNVERRLGAAKSSMFEVRGVAELKQSRFFEKIDWEALYDRELSPPFKPAPVAHNASRKGGGPPNVGLTSVTSPPPDDLFKGFSFVASNFYGSPKGVME